MFNLKESMKIIKLIVVLIAFTKCGWAQVPQTSVVEHFTNTSCSICASNNGFLYSSLNNNPGVLHISFHPSSPYSNDFFNQQNMAENDSRTIYYNVFGSTPRVVLNGSAIPLSTINTALNSVSTNVSNYSIRINQVETIAGNFNVQVVVKKEYPDNLTSALLFVGAVEDTVYQTTNNGETVHYNVFRKALSATSGDMISLPAQPGDSIVVSYSYLSGSTWNSPRMYSLGILQDVSKTVINSAKSDNTSLVSTGVAENLVGLENKVVFYPNPAVSDVIYANENITEVQIISPFRNVVYVQNNIKNSEPISISKLPEGVYVIKALINGNIYFTKLIVR